MLPIRRTCHFLLDPQKGWTALKIRYRIRYAGYVTTVAVGYRAEPSKWNAEVERCQKNTSHGDKRTPAAGVPDHTSRPTIPKRWWGVMLVFMSSLCPVCSA